MSDVVSCFEVERDVAMWDPRPLAAAVVAACREATVAQQAELLGGEVESGNWRVEPHPHLPHLEYVRHDVRAVGPWREDP